MSRAAKARGGLVGLVACVGLLALAGPAVARPRAPATKPAKAAKAAKVAKAGGHGRLPRAAKKVATDRDAGLGHDAGPGAATIHAPGVHAGPRTPEDAAAAQLTAILHGPLRASTTGLLVADARDGTPLFAINAGARLNPASNVKMISTAAALELLGPTFRYPTRVLGPAPDALGVIHGDVYLLGSHDPTLTFADLDDLGAQLARAGVHQIDGAIVTGADPSRDGVFRAALPIEVVAGDPGKPATARPLAGVRRVKVVAKVTTGRRPGAAHLRATATATTIDGQPGQAITVTGTIGRGGQATTTVAVADHVALAAAGLQATLARHTITVAGARTGELAEFGRAAAAAGALPIELARHESAPLSAIVAQVNKRSINWLADRVIMTAAALTAPNAPADPAHPPTPTMPRALDAMYAWLGRRGVTRDQVVLDTGSGLSYNTKITVGQLVAVVRGAAGYEPGAPGAHDPALALAWRDSLSIAGADGTLGRRFRGSAAARRLHGKTGTLSTVVALSGVLDLDPARPLAFAIVSNGHSPAAKQRVRAAHEQLIGVVCRYLAATRAPTPEAPASTASEAPAPAVTAPTAAGGEPPDEDAEVPGPEDALPLDPPAR